MNPDKDIVPFVNPNEGFQNRSVAPGDGIAQKMPNSGWHPGDDARLGATSSISAFVPRRPAS